MPSRSRAPQPHNPQSHNHRIREIIAVTRSHRLEFAAQITLMTLAGLIAWAATGLGFIPVWLVTHYGFIALERYETWRLRNHDSLAALIWVLLLHLLVGITFAAMPVYLWLHPVDGYQFAGMALLVGSTLNIFLVRAQLWYQALCFVLPNSIAIATIASAIAQKTATTGQGVTVIVIAAAILIYYGVAVVQASRAHRRYLTTREQLDQAQKMEALGNLAGGMAHDFNNILNVITGTIELLRDEKDPAEIRLRLKQADAAAERGAALIRQVLAFARKSHLRPRRVEVAQLMDEVQQMTRRLITERVTIDFHCGPDLPPIRVDEAALVTALLNLVLNARDAIDGAGQITLTCTVEPDPRNRGGKRAVFEVRDTGRGIPPTLIGRVTEPFFTTKREGEGTGLGLSMVAGFAAQSGGVFLIESAPGQGTLARIFLPVDSAPADRDAPAPKASSPQAIAIPEAPTPAYQPSKILVVEDQRELLDLLVLFLRRSGHTVEAAGSGDDALAQLEAGLRVDLVISDMVMPGQMQGRDLAAYLRANRPETRVVLMSGFDAEEFAATAEVSEDVIYLTKPVRLADLADLIARP